MQRLAEPLQAQRLHVVLQVRRGELRAGAGEGAELRGRHGHGALLHQRVLRRHAGLADERVGRGVQRLEVLHLEDQAELQVVLQVLADAGQRMQRLDAIVLQHRRIADAGELQQVGRVDRAGRQAHHQPGAAPAGEGQAQRLGLGPERQVGPVQGGLEEAGRRGPAHAALLVDLEVAAALVVAAVEVVHLGYAVLGRRFAEEVQHAPGQAHVLDPPLAALTVQFVGAAHAVLRAPEVGQQVGPAPAGIAELAPMVVVGGLAAHVDHAVDRRAAADHLAARVVQRAPVEARLGLGLEAPVRPRVAHGVEVADRDAEPDPVVLAADWPARRRPNRRRRRRRRTPDAPLSARPVLPLRTRAC